MTEPFGPLYGAWDVEQAVVLTLRTWINEYLHVIEQMRGLQQKTIPRPPAEQSIHGGLDFETWIEALSPEVIVVVEPEGEPERTDSVGYTQLYEIQVGTRWVGMGSALAQTGEDEARAVASYYGTASQLLVQIGELQGITTQQDSLVMVGAPRLTFPMADQRQTVQVVTTFRTYLEIVNQNSGPVQNKPSESPLYGGEPEGTWGTGPEVKTVKNKISAEQI